MEDVNLLSGQFSVNLSGDFLAIFLDSFLTIFLASVLTRVLGKRSIINTVYSTTRPKQKTSKTPLEKSLEL